MKGERVLQAVKCSAEGSLRPKLKIRHMSFPFIPTPVSGSVIGPGGPHIYYTTSTQTGKPTGARSELLGLLWVVIPTGFRVEEPRWTQGNLRMTQLCHCQLIPKIGHVPPTQSKVSHMLSMIQINYKLHGEEGGWSLGRIDSVRVFSVWGNVKPSAGSWTWGVKPFKGNTESGFLPGSKISILCNHRRKLKVFWFWFCFFYIGQHKSAARVKKGLLARGGGRFDTSIIWAQLKT